MHEGGGLLFTKIAWPLGYGKLCSSNFGGNQKLGMAVATSSGGRDLGKVGVTVNFKR